MIRTALATTRSRLTRTLVSAGLAGAAGLALVALPATDANAAPAPCTGASCFVDLSIHPDGLSIGAVLHTGPATTATLLVYQGNTLWGHASDSAFRKEHGMYTAATLTANTAYTWRVRVWDRRGNSFERTGTVTTLHRRVTVQFITDTVTNDSDDDSAGDFETMVGVGNQHAVASLMAETINSGETKPMAALLVLHDAGTTTQIATEMYDDDMPFTSWYPAIGGATWNNGSDEFADWATAQGTLNTTYATNAFVPFQISVDSYVGFTVRGNYVVDFVS